MGYMETYQEWLTSPYFDEDTKQELRAIEGDEKEIQERFYADLEFGTGGLRGVIGAGIKRMNKYVVRRATQGLANYIKKMGSEAMGVAIAHDSRRMSTVFAEEAALTLAANGIKAYVFDSLRPTPELSFAVRYYGCTAGINITASHNPPEYNGYKAYWADGAQCTPPHDAGIMAEVKAQKIDECRTMDKAEAMEAGLYQVIGREVDTAYMEELKKQIRRQDCIDEAGKDIVVVYTPLHGTGNIPVRRILSEIGFPNVYVVPEQELPDGNFPTVSYPNPEAAEAFDLALALAKEKNADLVLATDPDADRLGVYVKDGGSGEYKCLTGNMSGCLLADYEISQWKEKKGLPEDGVLVSTIVSTNLAGAIAKKYGVKLVETLTGFKYIGEHIRKMEENGSGTFLFGFEESYGCLIGTHARDKDAVVASMALCEAAAYYRTQGRTLWDAMMDIYHELGFYKDASFSLTLKGLEGLEKIRRIMSLLRVEEPEKIGSWKVLAVRDYELGIIKEMENYEVTPAGLPRSNVLYYELEDDAWCCIRPSGTEPKIKVYYGVKGTSFEEADRKSEELGKALAEMVNDIE